MRRLTETDDSGNWRLKGLPWKDICTGTVLTRETSMKIYSALCKLLEYEETGLDPDEIERMQDGYLPPEKWEAIDRAYADMCRELAACKKALRERGEKIPGHEKKPEAQDGVPGGEYLEVPTWKDGILHRFMRKE